MRTCWLGAPAACAFWAAGDWGDWGAGDEDGRGHTLRLPVGAVFGGEVIPQEASTSPRGFLPQSCQLSLSSALRRRLRSFQSQGGWARQWSAAWVLFSISKQLRTEYGAEKPSNPFGLSSESKENVGRRMPTDLARSGSGIREQLRPTAGRRREMPLPQREGLGTNVPKAH